MNGGLIMKEVTNSDPFTIVGTEQYNMVSKMNREYRIFVSKPSEKPPASGYPVIYLLDGNSIFGTVVEAIRIQSKRPEKTGIVPAIVVGIGYPTEAPFSPHRFYDYTMAQTDQEMPFKPDGKPWPKQGGASEFLSFIEEELKPKIHQTLKVDSNKQTIFGHSLGGLFVLYTLFTSPRSFQSYIAGSPSLHWNERNILAKERSFMARLEREAIHAKLLIGIGELEKEHKSNIGELAKKMSERLSFSKNRGLNVKFIQFEDECHTSVLPPLINKSLRFSLHSQVDQ